MKLLRFFICLLFTHTAYADVAEPIRCQGKNVSLVVTRTWLGDEQSSQTWSQRIFSIRESDDNDSLAYAAYFLDVSEEGAAGSTTYIGKNHLGGEFYLYVNGTEDGVGDIARPNSKASLSYSHGPLQGKDIEMTCSPKQ